MDIGDMGVPFIYQGEELIYPEYVKDGLVLHYDFSGMTNNDASRGIARDLSGNGNHGTLQNFNFTPESGYDKNKLLFDGVDDGLDVLNTIFGDEGSYTINLTFKLITNPHKLTGIFMVSSGVGRVWIRVGTSSITANLYLGDGMDYGLTFSNVVILGDVINVTFKIDRENHFLETFLNDEKIDSRDISKAAGIPISDGFIRLGMMSTYQPPNAEYHSVKVYNRPLSPEEIAHNYAIEKERFGIE